MKNLQIHAALIALPLLLAATGESLAWTKTFGGTRDQVRTACAKVGGDLMDGPGSTTCFNNKNGTGVTCYNDGTCDGGGPGPGPGRMGSTMGLRGQPLSSGTLSESDSGGTSSSESSGGAESGDGGAPPAGNGSDPGGDVGGIGDMGWHASDGGSPGQIN